MSLEEDGASSAASSAKTAPNYALKATLRGHQDSISSVKFSGCGRWLCSSSADGTVKLWHGLSGKFERNLLQLPGVGVSDVAWNASGSLVAAACDDHVVRLLPHDHPTGDAENGADSGDALGGGVAAAKTGGPKSTLRGHEAPVFAVNWNPVRQAELASGGMDDTVRVWDAQRPSHPLLTLQGHYAIVSSVCFNRDGSLLASSGYDGTVRLWDARSGQCLKSIQPRHPPLHGGAADSSDAAPCSYCAFSPNGKYLLAASWDSTLRLLGCAQGNRLLKTYRGHVNQRYCGFAQFSVTGGKWIVSGSEDGRVYLWDLQSQQPVQIISHQQHHAQRGDGGPAMAVACHPSQNIIATGSLLPDEAQDPGGAFRRRSPDIKLWISDY